jgi:class 3 adenylate cyclase
MNRWTVTMEPRADETRVLMMEGRDERMRAVLGPSTLAHPRAAQTLLEGLALWHQSPLSVVLCADVEGSTSALRLEDALGFGVRNLHFEVEVALHARGRRRARRLPGLGSFGDLRQLCLEGVTP